MFKEVFGFLPKAQDLEMEPVRSYTIDTLPRCIQLWLRKVRVSKSTNLLDEFNRLKNIETNLNSTDESTDIELLAKRWLFSDDNIDIYMDDILAAYLETSHIDYYWVEHINGHSLIKWEGTTIITATDNMTLQQGEPWKYIFTKEEVATFDGRLLPFLSTCSL